MVRVSKSMCINIYFLSGIQADFNMKAKLLMKNGEVLQLNRSYKNDFYKFISALRGGRENHAADH